MARGAYEGGADYMYRVNDDTEFLHHWPAIFVGALNSIPSRIGVVGPTCTQGNTEILTHDFVARVHMEIMEMNYYPPELVDWWMDDWISYVYGHTRSFRASQVHVIHHTGAHGRRYEVDSANHKHLTSQMEAGRRRIRGKLLKLDDTGADDAPVVKWDAEMKKLNSRRGHVFKLRDVPKGLQANAKAKA